MQVVGLYEFRSVTEADLPLLARWRAAPHVVRWWGFPEVEPAVEALADPRIAMWIASQAMDTRWGRALLMERWR